jgi:hypothetical protein
MEAIVERDNLRKALAQVKRNKGAAGVDGMSIGALSPYLKEHWPTIRAQLLDGTYKPQPVRRVEIPKATGGKRPLGIPTVLDRFIQQAVLQVLQLGPDVLRWRPEVAVMPRAVIDGDRVYLTGVRNFDYRTRNDFTVRYEERELQLSHLTALDFYVSYFTEGPVGHTFVSFIFDNAPPLSISIETRPEVGEGFAPVASLFKQFELIYVIGDERDLVRVRTNYRGEPVYLYRLNTSAADARRLLLIYLGRINELADRPEFYNLLTNSCTINIVRYANAAGRSGGFDIRHLLNGLIDGYLYYSGRMDTTLPFDELRRRSLINEPAQAADGAADFSERIRASLPTISR